MKLKEQLKYFLKTGRLKHIDFGLTRLELIKIIGNKGDKHFSFKENSFPSIYKYGKFEFYFMEDKKESKLSGIMFQPWPTNSDSGNLNCTYHRWTSNLEISKAIQFLKSNNILFEEKEHQWDSDVRMLVTEGDVKILFDDQSEAGHYILHQAGKFIDID